MKPIFPKLLVDAKYDLQMSDPSKFKEKELEEIFFKSIYGELMEAFTKRIFLAKLDKPHYFSIEVKLLAVEAPEIVEEKNTNIK